MCLIMLFCCENFVSLIRDAFCDSRLLFFFKKKREEEEEVENKNKKRSHPQPLKFTSSSPNSAAFYLYRVIHFIRASPLSG